MADRTIGLRHPTAAARLRGRLLAHGISAMAWFEWTASECLLRVLIRDPADPDCLWGMTLPAARLVPGWQRFAVVAIRNSWEVTPHG